MVQLEQQEVVANLQPQVPQEQTVLPVPLVVQVHLVVLVLQEHLLPQALQVQMDQVEQMVSRVTLVNHLPLVLVVQVVLLVLVV